jgi:hypothetical protein
MEVRPVVRRRRLGKHADDDSKEPRDLWHRHPPSLDKAALSLAMGNALTSGDFAWSAVVLWQQLPFCRPRPATSRIVLTLCSRPSCGQRVDLDARACPIHSCVVISANTTT